MLTWFLRGAALPLLTVSAFAADQWNGIALGTYEVGFRFERTVDPTRNINSRTRGTSLGLAIWYPAQKSAASGRPMTQAEYRLLSFSEPLDAVAREAFLNAEAEMMVAWRHVGIVPLTIEQARAAIQASGHAFRGASAAPGKFPVVLVLGGQWYLSTTAEILASRGFLVVAPVRFSDESNEIPMLNFTWYMENSSRDAEWALSELSRDASAEIANVSVLGHGGGGMQAMLVAMRNRGIRAVANVDAGNFSSRSQASQLNFYHPRLMRAPYLFIATGGTRQDQDQFAEFEKMRFSRRYEVVLENPALRHHDLSDVGRAVSASLGIRGEAQDAVLRNYAAVQQMLLQFLETHGRGVGGDPARFATWLQQGGTGGGYSVTLRDSVEPAPITADVLRSLDDRTPERLAEAHRRDPEARLFSEDELQKLITAARTRNKPALAAKLARFAMELHPKSLAVHQSSSAALESAGDAAGAREIATRCVAIESPRNDWRAAAAQAKCKEQVERLR